MSGSKSPAPASAPAEENQQNDATNATTNGHRSPDAETAEPAKVVNGSPKRSIEQDDGSELPDAPPPATNGFPSGPTEGDEDANSEAETVLTSPVKKREAEKRVEAIKQEKPDQPALPAPAAVKEEEDAEDDDDADAPGSPDDSAVPTSAAPANKANLQDRADGRLNKSRDRSSEPLSDVSPTRSGTGQSSRASSNSRAQSERPDSSSKHDNKESPNPRKRKHRASSVNLPNKRPSMDVAKRRLRDLHSEGVAGGNTTARSPSPSRRGHRRAVSTQSAILDGSSDAQGNRKRRAVTQFPVREPKAAKTTWEDSSVSSEATSHGQGEVPRRQRGIGRSTSTPGRPPGREHKRHINKYGFTKLAEACEDGDLELVKEWRHKDPDQLEIEEFAKNTPLQIASLNGNSEVVEYLIGEGCRIDCYNVDKDTPLIDAAENGHADVVDILLNAGVDPLRQNLKGQQALDVVNDDTENAAEIRASLRKAMEKWNSVDARKRREHEEEQRFSSRPSGELHFMARTYENLHKLVVNNDRNSVREFLDARVPVDNNIIAAAAKTGDSYLINMLLAEMTEKKAFQKPEKPLLSVLGTSHLETVKSLTELDQFNPLWRNRQGKTWPEIADERHGPMWKQESELLHRLYNEAREKADRRSSSPVTKRDEVKRRPPPQSGDNSEDESPPKRKNGKRLMSRREMRAASGKPFSDSSSDESSSETAREAEESMKPPESPNTKRGPGRPRKSSTSSQPADLPQEVARTRRRSSSVREKAEPTLPIVDEQMEDVDAAADAKPEEKADAERTEAAANSASTPENTKAKEEAAKKAEEDAKKKAEDEAKEAFEAEALKREDEARKKEEEESKARKAEEDARKAAEEKRAEEQRQAEEAKLREEEEARKAESARKAEEQRKRLERELSEAKSKHRQELASSLPTALARTLDPALDENEQSRMAIEALEAFTPLQVLPFANASSDDSGPKLRTELFVLNAQAAPLLGKVGLDLLLRQDAPGFEDSLAHTWKSLPLDDADRDCVQAILPSHILVSEPVDEDEDMLEKELSFEAELSRRARQVHSAQEAQSKLERANLELRWVKLQDVLDNLHPVLRDAPIDLRTDVRRPQDHARTLKSIQASNTPDFFGRVSEWWKQSSLPHAIQNGKAAMHSQWSVGTTEVRVSHEK